MGNGTIVIITVLLAAAAVAIKKFRKQLNLQDSGLGFGNILEYTGIAILIAGAGYSIKGLENRTHASVNHKRSYRTEWFSPEK
jgi:hypothetical protein